MGREIPVSRSEGGEVADRARELIRRTCLALDIRIERGHVGKDYVHILASNPPTVSPSDKRIKGRSSRTLRKEFTHLRKRQEGKALLGQGMGHRGWARGYFCVGGPGRVTEEQIQDHVEGHDQEPPDPDFTVEGGDGIGRSFSRLAVTLIEPPRLPVKGGLAGLRSIFCNVDFLQWVDREEWVLQKR